MYLRFVSHEVRTPLNAVSMGLDLMQHELAKSLGFDCSTSFRAEYEMVDSNIGMQTSFHTNQGLSYSRHSLSALGSVYQFVFEAQLQLDLYNQAVEGDLAIDDVVLHPGCV